MMKITKKELLNEIKAAIKEEYVDMARGPQSALDNVGMKTKKAYERDRDEEEPFDQHFPMVQAPRARVSDIESHKKVYSYLMGRPGASMKMSLEELMKEFEAGCPMSSAQALADYLSDRARLK